MTNPFQFCSSKLNNTTAPYMLSGRHSRGGEHPHYAAIRTVDRAGAVRACGASIISKQWLLTAAHCTANQISILVRAGLKYDGSPEVSLETTEYYLHSTFDASRSLAVQANDISLIKL